jgi:hypothetical protein
MPTPGSQVVTPPQIVALVSPVGIIPPPTSSTTGPLTILPGSKGFDENHLFVYLGNNPSDGTPITQQALGLSFYGQGLAAGGVLHFSLTVASSLANKPPQLDAVDPTSSQPLPYITITADPSNPVTTGGNPAPESQIPEPLSLLVWSALAGAGLMRAARSRWLAH